MISKLASRIITRGQRYRPNMLSMTISKMSSPDYIIDVITNDIKDDHQE